MQLLRDLAHTSRLPNLPTVWSNVITGYLVGVYFSTNQAGSLADILPKFSWTPLALIVLASTFLYLCGTFLNDGIDVEWDRKNRPERPAPSGRIPAETLVNLALVFGILGVGLTIMLGKFTTVLAGCIIASILLYTAIHKKTAWGALPMGLCRALLFPMAALVGHQYIGGEINQLLLICAAASVSMLCYVAAITWFARNETREGAPTPGLGYWAKTFAFSLPLLIPVIVIPLIGSTETFWSLTPALVMASLAAIWLSLAMEKGRRQGVGAFISPALAGIPLVDALFIPNTELWILMIPIGLFLLSLVFQRITSAT